MAKRQENAVDAGAPIRRKPQAVNPETGADQIKRLAALIGAHLAVEPIDWRAVARASRSLAKLANGCSRWRAVANGAE